MSGFVLQDPSTGEVCAGARYAAPFLAPDKVPVNLTCAKSAAELDGAAAWGQPEQLFVPAEGRNMPFDVMAWRDADAQWYIGLASDACRGNAAPCLRGGAIELWQSPALRGPHAAYAYKGLMVAVNTSMESELHCPWCPPPAHRREIHTQLTTPSFTGGFPGDPRGGRTRMLTQAGQAYYLGVQANAGQLVDSAGGMSFTAPGERGMLDWGTATYRSDAGGANFSGVMALETLNPAKAGPSRRKTASCSVRRALFKTLLVQNRITP